MAKKMTSNDNKDENKVVSKELVMNLLHDIEKKRSDSAKISGDVSSLFTLAEKQGVHKSAFKACMKIHEMPEQSRAEFLAAFDTYRDYMALDEYDQGEMFGGEAA